MNETIKVLNTPSSSSSASGFTPNTNGTGGSSGAPSGTVGVKVRNPLYSYRFQNGSVMFGFSPTNLKLNPHTERCVREATAENGTVVGRKSEPWKAQEGMEKLGRELRDTVVGYTSLFLCWLVCGRVGLGWEELKKCSAN